MLTVEREISIKLSRQEKKKHHRIRAGQTPRLKRPRRRAKPCALWTRNREGEEAALGCTASQSSRLGLVEKGPTVRTAWAGRRVLTHALVRGPRGQGAAIEAILTLVTERTCRVVQATQAMARQGVAVAHGVGVHVPTALALLAGLGVPRESQRVPEKAIITDLTAPP